VHHGLRSKGSRPAAFCGLLSDELINIEDVRQEEVPDDHERDQTEGNDHTSESVTGPNCRPHDHRRGQADRKPDCRILHVAKHEVTLAPGTRSDTDAARIATSTSSWKTRAAAKGDREQHALPPSRTRSLAVCVKRSERFPC
jgi:hypothetical protein